MIKKTLRDLRQPAKALGATAGVLCGEIVLGFCLLLPAAPLPATEPSAWETPAATAPAPGPEKQNLIITNPLKLFLLGGIYFYQNFLSSQDGPTCQFAPSCSRYGVKAISQYGAFQGTLLTADRLLRCNPFTRGKYESTPDGKHYADEPGEHALW
jgi:putative membrane protein insertion efficiency factor